MKQFSSMLLGKKLYGANGKIYEIVAVWLEEKQAVYCGHHCACNTAQESTSKLYCLIVDSFGSCFKQELPDPGMTLDKI